MGRCVLGAGPTSKAESGLALPLMARSSFEVRIDALVPYEVAGIAGIVEDYRRKIRAGRELRDVRVIDVSSLFEAGELLPGNLFLVTDGTNRVLALRAEGISTARCRLGPLSAVQRQAYLDTVLLRFKDGQFGFNNTAWVPSASARRHVTEIELAKMREAEFYDSLQALVGPLKSRR